MWRVLKLLHLWRYVVIDPNGKTVEVLFSNEAAAQRFADALNRAEGTAQ